MKTILLTGATSGRGLATARRLAANGHQLLIHGRRHDRLVELERELNGRSPGRSVRGYVADLSRLTDVVAMASRVAEDHEVIDVLINNAGVFKTSSPTTESGHDIRFVVNAFAPYVLTSRLLSRVPPAGRVVNLSSAPQHPVDIQALEGTRRLGDFDAYAQSKLAITAWT